MIGLEDRVKKQELPDWMSRGRKPVHNELNFEYAVAVLKTEDNIRWFEQKSGIYIPDKYKKNITPQYAIGR